MNLENYLTVITTTHIHSYAPSTEIIENTFKTLYSNFKGIEKCLHLLYVDNHSKDQIYREYMRNLYLLKNTYPNLKIIDSPNTGYKINYLSSINRVSTPYMLFVEHDWNIIHPVNIIKLIQIFEKYSKVNLVKLPNKRYWDIIVDYEHEIKELSLTKTSSFATNPHIIRVSKFLNEWINYLYHPKADINSIEEPIKNNYNDQIKKYGFEQTHQKWGCYNYGPPTGPKYVEHLDASKSGKI